MRKTPISKNPRTKAIQKDQKDLNKIRGGISNMWLNIIISSLFSGIIGFFICFYFFKKGPSKKDFEPVNKGITQVGQNVSQVGQDISQLRQDILKNHDYKKYLEDYQLLYKKSLEQLLPGGYRTFGVRDSIIFDPDNFTNKDIQFNVEGTIIFKGKDCFLNMNLKNIYVTESGNSAYNNRTGTTIINYEIGKPYRLKTIRVSGWDQYIIILSDDIANPVFVFGFAKEQRNKV